MRFLASCFEPFASYMKFKLVICILGEKPLIISLHLSFQILDQSIDLLKLKYYIYTLFIQILFGLLRGCDFNGLAPFMSAVTANKDKIQIIGFVQKGWLHRSANDPAEVHKVHEDFSSKDLKVLGILYNEKQKEKCEYQLYDPSDIRLVNDTAQTHQNSNLFKKQFKINSEILDSLFADSNLLSSIDEEDIGQKQIDIFTLNTRTMIMKLINYQLQNNSASFLAELKKSNYYQHLLKFVCRESSFEMKGDIMLLEWLEQRCFAIRKYACENQQSLVKQREVHITLVKDKIYVSFQHPILKNEKQLNGIQLVSAINYKNFEEKTEIKLVHAQDVFITNDAQAKAEKQIVLIDPETLQRSNGFDILNAGIAAITYGVDLNKIIKNIFIKQRENRDLYLDLAQKTIFLVTEENFRKIQMLSQSNQFKRPSSMKVASQNEDIDNEDDNFDQIFAKELVNYGGFAKGLAKKTLQNPTIEAKTEALTQICKQVKEGLIDPDDLGDEQELPSPEKLAYDANEEQEITTSKKHAEERSETLVFLKTSFTQYMERQHSDKQEKSTKDALYDAINNYSKKELAADYEKSMIRLFNMYCRHVFWSLIQKDDIEKIFRMVLETEQDLKSFSIFLKVLGNECFITGNKVYIKGFKGFMKKVVHVCCRVSTFRPLLKLLIQEGIIDSYQNLLDEIKNDKKEQATLRIEDYFKTESKASQLINPYIIVPMLQQIVKEDFTLLEPNLDRIVSSLISINCAFVGNYKLKDKTWVLIISILEKVRTNLASLDQDIVKKLLRLKIVDALFGGFEEQRSYSREEAEYAKKMFKENSNSEIDGIPRKDVERLVYSKRATILTTYKTYSNKELQQILIEMLFKFYQIDKLLKESQFSYKNKQLFSFNIISLTSHLSLYRNILEQGRSSSLLEYMLFYNKLEIQQRTIVHTIDTNHEQDIKIEAFSEFKGSFRVHIKYPSAEKILFKVNDTQKSLMQINAAILLSTDKAGRNVEALYFEDQVKKGQAMKNIYADNFYLHYPVFPSAVYMIQFTDENSKQVPQLIEQPIYNPLDRYEDQQSGKYYVTKGNKVYIWKNDELRRYKDHLDIYQITFGKQCRVILLKNGKVLGEGRNKCRHLIDNPSEQNEVKTVEIPFYEKKDKIVQISTYFQVTVALTEKGKVFACGDKLAQITKIDNAKFGFYEVPLSNEDGEKEWHEAMKDLVQPPQSKYVEELKASDEKEIKPKDELVKSDPKPEPISEQPPNPPQVENKAAESEIQPKLEIEQGVKQYDKVVSVQLPNPIEQHDLVVQIDVQVPVEEVKDEEVKAVENLNEQAHQSEEVNVEEVLIEVPAENEEVKADLVAQELQLPEKDDQEEAKTSEAAKQEPEIIKEIEQINTESLLDLTPELRALKVYAGKTASTADFVYVAVVLNLKTNKLEVRTVGASQFGMLGQGPENKTSTVFKKIRTHVEIRSPDDIIIGQDHILMIGIDNKVYGWGCFAQEGKHNFLPAHIPFFDDYIIQKLLSGSRTTALVTPKSDPLKQSIIIGRFIPLHSETTFKSFEQFQDYNIYNIQTYGEKLYVSTLGTYQYRKEVPNPYIHEQICEISKTPVEGVLHFFKDKEQKFHYFSQESIQNGQVAQKYQPDFMFVVKRPIKDLESKPWPENDTSNLLIEEQRGSPIYLSKIKVGEKIIEKIATLDEIREDSIDDVVPRIYLSLSRHLKDEAVIEPLQIALFYEQSSTYGLSANITPDYGFSEESQELITKNQAAYDEFRKSIGETQLLEEPLKKEFNLKVEEYVFKKLKDQEISEIKYQELKVHDELKFASDKLNELSDSCKLYGVGKFILYCQYVWGLFTYVSKNPSANQDLTLVNVYNQYRHQVPLVLKNSLIKKLIANMGYDDNTVSIHVNRKKAQEFFETGKIDEKGEYTVFAQVQRELSSRQYQGLRINSADKKAWFVKFIGEFALDLGGLFRESLTELCQELQSHVLNLLIPTQNQKNNYGENRDKWILNPGINTPTQLKQLEFLGALMGMCVRSGILMSLNLSSFVWKQLAGEQLTLSDLDSIDSMTVQVLEGLKDIQTQMDEETFLTEYELNMTTILSNGEEVELLPGGKHIKVTYANIEEYISKTISFRLNECQKQIKRIRKGISITFDANFLRMLSWKDLEYKVVGKETLDIERLKEITVYRNCSETSDTIKKYWKIISLFTNEERMLYLKFVWGRTRLPLKEEEVLENHTIQMDESADIGKLPVGRTCFFRLEIPAYKNEDTFREKLMYAIRFCTDIDADIENAVQQEDDHQNQNNGRQDGQASQNSDGNNEHEYEGNEGLFGEEEEEEE